MGGLGHDMKAGVNYIHEPRLFITFNTGTNDYTYNHLDNDVNGPLSSVTRNGGAAEANIPLDQYAFYVQDDWRVTDRLTLNLGLRYDVIDGIQIDQSGNPNFVKVQEAGRAGLLAGIKGLENVGLDPKEDTNNWQPRVGFAYDLRGDGRDVIRGGWGIYTDMGYTNSNVLFPAHRCDWYRFRRRLQRRRTRRASAIRMARSTASDSRSRTSRARTSRIRTRCRSSASGSIRGSRCRTRVRPRSAGRTSSTTARCSSRTSCATTAVTSTSVRASTRVRWVSLVRRAAWSSSTCSRTPTARVRQ